ncbi:MAG: glycosyltransferase family 2 protein [Flavobacteriales bacterium]
MLSISVCIPVYRSDVRKLVLSLIDQVKRIDTAQIDILLIDDASGEPYPKLNSFEDALVKTHNLDQNVGRAKIRNLFLAHSTAKYLLFLDGDSTVLNEKFLYNYVQHLLNQDVQVLVGASCYQQERPSASCLLRWRYSTQRESLSYTQRLAQKDAGFKTNNFLIERSVLAAHPFEEGLSGYGHEDTLFGVHLVKAKVVVQHIDNPVWNLNLDDNVTFLYKTDQALRNLLWIYEQRFSPELLNHNALLASYLKLKSHLLGRALLWLIQLVNPVLKSTLLTGRAPLIMFDVYRLGRINALQKLR